MDLNLIGTTLLANPLIQGMILSQVKAFIEAALKKVDDEGLAKKNEQWLQPLLVVLTLITSAITLALQGQIHTLDLSALQTYLVAAVNMYLGAKAAGSQTVTNLTKKVVK